MDSVDLLSYLCGANFFLAVYHMLTVVPGRKIDFRALTQPVFLCRVPDFSLGALEYGGYAEQLVISL